ncbi:type III-B CRISPR-associated protein Cas10/Cmr2 [Geobacillus sp. WSUCF1]|uniref:type III-B CRISPR-associated protein Cas10/Cmr2 n=1 Tax=Geobacillus sp. WSUCF1 TaxID=886559 RepID=UPI0003588107|nr:type III-B CRISPR-associated protein Cas10/Cmr2 [Geobacillus sp. WSUCF1]EPR26946.1 putative hydrolase of the HD superfamily (permuted catalytic motifs) [Geobacillus sp. WSUCF1]
MTNRYIVIFTVGPVQSFIASARKTEDFWSGSYILSHLVREAIKQFYQLDANCEVVYPLVTRRSCGRHLRGIFALLRSRTA